MRLTYPISAGFLLFALFIAWKWLPAREHAHATAGHDVVPELTRDVMPSADQDPGEVAAVDA